MKKYFYKELEQPREYDHDFFVFCKQKHTANPSKRIAQVMISNAETNNTTITVSICCINSTKYFDFPKGSIDSKNPNTFVPIIDEYISTMLSNKHRKVLINTINSAYGLCLSNKAIARVADEMKIKFNFIRINSKSEIEVVNREYAELDTANIYVATSKCIENIHKIPFKDFFTYTVNHEIMDMGRNHPILIKVFEELGDEKFSEYGKSHKIINVPKSWKWKWHIGDDGDSDNGGLIIRDASILG